MLGRFVGVSVTKVLARAGRPCFPVAAPVALFLSTSARPPEDISRPAPPPPDVRRKTGDEVEEEAFDPIGRIKDAADTIQDVLNRDGRLDQVTEEAYHSVPKFEEAKGMQAERGKEHLEGHVWPQDRQQKTIKLGEEVEKKDEGILGKVKDTVKHTLQEGMEKLKGGVEATTEAIRQAGAQHEEEMQAAAEAQRKEMVKEQRGDAWDQEAEVDEKGEVDQEKLEKKYEKHYESVVGAPVGPKK